MELTVARPGKSALALNIQRYLLAGVLTLVPVWITFVVFRFVLTQLSGLGRPWVVALSNATERYFPSLGPALLHPWFQNVLAVIITLLGLYFLGWLATRVVGRRIIAAFDSLIQRIPLVEKIYGATKKLLAALQQQPGAETQRVVLLEFPHPKMKTVGLVTRVLTDQQTGRKLAAVYVPTTPNPTSGYLEIVPLEELVSTDWTLDEAMTFIISGGSVAPDRFRYGPDDGERRIDTDGDAANPGSGDDRGTRTDRD
jgi:uncharacterized membrane protein